MKVLLDTHVLLWWVNDEARISKRARSLISDQNNTVMVSAATAWEIAIKVHLGKVQAGPLVPEVTQCLDDEGFVELPISIDQAVRAGLLPFHHRDPFDRLLVAQAQSLNLPILSADPILDQYDIKRIW